LNPYCDDATKERLLQKQRDGVRWSTPYLLSIRTVVTGVHNKKSTGIKRVSALYTALFKTHDPSIIIYPNIFRSSPILRGNPDRLSGKYTIVIPISTSQVAVVEKHKRASLVHLEINRSSTRKRAEDLPCGLPDCEASAGIRRSLASRCASRLPTQRQMIHVGTFHDGKICIVGESSKHGGWR
jgi:hypothetical protein